jgi:Cys-rich protein (TIGR01571 family)
VFYIVSVWLGLFCPCVLFGRNVERMREETPWTGPCTCHAIFVEGGMALALATAIFHGVDPHGAFLIGEGLLFAWWMCGIYTGLFRQGLQRKYHLQVIFSLMIPSFFVNVYLYMP